MVNYWIDKLFEPIFPATCILCGSPGRDRQDICPECFTDLPRIGNCCSRCALPLPENGICGRCLGNPPHFDRCIAPFRFEEPVRGLIHGLKFNRQLVNARLMAWLLQEYIDRQMEQPKLIVPVPLHPQRLKTRGYNQSLELARYLSRTLNIPISTRDCIRKKATSAQADLPKKQRRKNVKGAFAMNNPLAARHVAILDDVITTGSTVDELSRILKQGGVERIDVWSLARTP